MDGVTEALLGHFVQVGYRDSSRENGTVRMLRRKGGSGLCGEFIEFDGCDSGVDTLNDFLGNDDGVYELLSETVRMRERV